MLFDGQRGTRRESQSPELAQSRRVVVGNAADHRRVMHWPSPKRYFIAELAGLTLLRDGMSVGVEFRVSENCSDTVFKLLGNEMFKPLSLFVNLVPRILEDLVQEQFQETMVSD